MNKDLKALSEINNDFMHLTLSEQSIDEHLDEFLNLFLVHIPTESAIKCIVPTFYNLVSWYSWDTEVFPYLKYFSNIKPECLNRLFSIQSGLSDATVSFTGEALRQLTKNKSGRKTIRITIDNEESESFHTLRHTVDSKCETVNISPRSILRLRENYELNHYRPQDFTTYQIDKLNKSIISTNENDKFINGLTPSDIQAKNDFIQAVAKAILHHSYYIDSNHDLYYFFSNIVWDSQREGRDLGLGGVFVLVDKSALVDPVINGAFLDYFEQLSDKLATRIIQTHQLKMVIDQAKRSAISTLLNRNLSHNLGSHLLANLSNGDMIKQFVNQYVGIQSEKERLKENESRTLTIDKLNKEEAEYDKLKLAYVVLADLNSYLRTRMDFLADISTGTPVLETIKYINRDILIPFNSGNILLRRHITGNKRFATIHSFAGDPSAAFPNDHLSTQAFFILVENVIRNAAKHGKGKGDINIKFTWDNEHYEDLIEIIIFDNSDPKRSGLENLIKNQQDRIDKNILDNGVLRQGSWGMLEMKIVAAYLRKIPVEKIDKEDELKLVRQPRLLTAVAVENRFLGYKFYFLKPKDVLVICNPEIRHIQYSNRFLDRGIRFLSLGQILNTKQTHNHELILLVDCDGHDVSNQRLQMSSRIITITSMALNIALSKQSPDEFSEWAWGLWLKELQSAGPAVSISQITEDPYSIKKIKLFDQSDHKKIINAAFVFHCKQFMDKADYFEPCKGISPISDQLINLFASKPGFDNRLKCHFIEAINFSIGVIDERIQKQSQLGYDEDFKFKSYAEVWWKKGIEVPGKKIDLNAKTFSSRLRSELCLWIQHQALKSNFLVIHIGIIEKLLNLEQIRDVEKEQKIKTFLDEIRNIKDCKAVIIITSGRGQPESLPAGERFVHYSNVAQYIIEKSSKFHLVQLLLSARETKPQKHDTQ